MSIISVAGQNVAQPPLGSLDFPGVTFTPAGNITVTAQGQNIPDGTPVRLRLTVDATVIDKPATNEPSVVLTGAIATYSFAVPRGKGTPQAFAEFNVP